MFFWNYLGFSMIQQMLAIWSLAPLPFLKPAWTSGSLWFTYCWGSRDKFFVHFLMIQWMLAIWSLAPLPFLNPAWASGSSQFMYCWSRAWTSMWDEYNCEIIWTFFGIAFLWDWNENWPFPVLWPLLNFPNLLAYWVQYFHSIIF